MGVVWRATDQLLDRDVAVKEVRLNEALGDAERANAYKRTLREARTAARLSHRGVVTVFDVAEEDGRPWIIMELIQARSLREVVEQDGPLDPPAAARVGLQVLAALRSAHALGIMHRDVKPGNVLIEADGRAVLAGKVREIKATYERNRVIVEFEGSASFLSSDEIAEATNYSGHAEIKLKPQGDAQKLLHEAAAVARIYRFELVEPSLEEIFIEEVKKSFGETEAVEA